MGCHSFRRIRCTTRVDSTRTLSPEQDDHPHLRHRTERRRDLRRRKQRRFKALNCGSCRKVACSAAAERRYRCPARRTCTGKVCETQSLAYLKFCTNARKLTRTCPWNVVAPGVGLPSEEGAYASLPGKSLLRPRAHCESRLSRWNHQPK